MKALTQQELQTFVTEFGPILDGAQLQDILVNDRGLALGFRKDIHYWLILDLVPNSPVALLFEEQCPFQKGAKSKPVGLFLNSHAKNLYLTAIKIRHEFGRVLVLELKNASTDCEVEVRLIPKQCNVIVRSEGKQISWDRPMELSQGPVLDLVPIPRTLQQIHEEWLSEQNSQKKPAQDPQVQWEKKRQKDLEKKRKALLEIQRQIESDQHEFWAEAGQFLKSRGALDVPLHLEKYIDKKESLSWNIENCFFKAKQLVAKKDGARERYQEVIREIERLEKTTFRSKPQKQAINDLMQKADARGRKLNLESGAIAYCGRSAVDNLSLLRQAKAWDYWLHLRDFPGAHAIIHRQREQLIADSEIKKVAEWVAKESLSSKSLTGGQKVAVVMVECRFVRPIKGDKLGRVTYHSEKTFSFTLRHS